MQGRNTITLDSLSLWVNIDLRTETVMYVAVLFCFKPLDDIDEVPFTIRLCVIYIIYCVFRRVKFNLMIYNLKLRNSKCEYITSIDFIG